MDATRRQRILRPIALMLIGGLGAALVTLDPLGAFREPLFLLMFGAMTLWSVVESALLRQDEPREYAAKLQTRMMQGGVMLAILVGVADWWHLRALFPRTLLLTVAGLALLTVGAIIRIVAIRTLERHFSYELRIERDHRLIDHGIYATLRHPSYLGILLIGIGAPLVMQSVVGALVGAGLMAALVVWRIRTEEAMLHGAFGTSYAAYAKRTWRIIPYVY